jgi:nicotinamidase-related amidase
LRFGQSDRVTRWHAICLVSLVSARAGVAIERASVALLLIDVINDFQFPGGSRLGPRAVIAARKLARLKARLSQVGVPIIYANDNFGRWRSQFSEEVQHCARASTHARDIVNELAPAPNDYFVLKPKHSGFHQTCLELLLREMQVETLIVGGFSTDSCVSFTAYDAHQRGFSLLVLSDGCAAMTAARHANALSALRNNTTARTPVSSAVYVSRRAEKLVVSVRG